MKHNIILVIILLITGCNAQNCAHYPEIERSEEFDLVYYTLLHLFEEVKKPVDAECVYYTRRVKIKWKDRPKSIGHYFASYLVNPSILALYERLRSQQLIRILAHEMIHGFEFCAYDSDERMPKHKILFFGQMGVMIFI